MSRCPCSAAPFGIGNMPPFKASPARPVAPVLRSTSTGSGVHVEFFVIQSRAFHLEG